MGVVVPYDMVLDYELWQWTPPGVCLYFTRTPDLGQTVTIDMVSRISEPEVVRSAAATVRVSTPAVTVYGCTSGSFCRGVAAERELAAEVAAGAGGVGLTTSGALLAALAALGAGPVSVVAPYTDDIAALLHGFLAEAGHEVITARAFGASDAIWDIDPERTLELIRQADDPRSEAVVVSCTNLPTIDIIQAAEAELGKPVVSANQATMWLALAYVGSRLTTAGQRLSACPARLPKDRCS